MLGPDGSPNAPRGEFYVHLASPAPEPAPPTGRIWRLPGVYAPQADSFLLAQAMRREGIGAGMDVLDVCTGSGVLALCAARLGARVSAVDVSRRAVLSARLNTVPAGVPLTAAAEAGRPHSLGGGARRPPAARPDLRRGSGGAEARRATAPGALRSGRPESTLRRLRAAGLHASVRERAITPFGPVMTGRLSWMRERGLVSEPDTAEELVAVRAIKE